jgi:hypothetical protein
MMRGKSIKKISSFQKYFTTTNFKNIRENNHTPNYGKVCVFLHH